ncbi:hypothetical protein VTO73DRAFT_4322 [Trametes versicolor]
MGCGAIALELARSLPSRCSKSRRLSRIYADGSCPGYLFNSTSRSLSRVDRLALPALPPRSILGLRVQDDADRNAVPLVPCCFLMHPLIW